MFYATNHCAIKYKVPWFLGTIYLMVLKTGKSCSKYDGLSLSRLALVGK